MTDADADRFTYYVREIAPYLAILAEACAGHGIPFVAAIQWAPGQVEATVHVPAGEDMDADCRATMGFATAVAKAIYRPLWQRMAERGHPEPLATDDEDRPRAH